MAERSIVKTDAAPAAVGPYSQAIAAGGFIFTAGQIGLDAGSGEIVPGGVGAETRRVLDILGAVLEAAGVGFDDVVKTTIYLVDMDHFAEVNAIYAERFAAAPPARSTVAVAALPKGALVEIDAVAIRSSEGLAPGI